MQFILGKIYSPSDIKTLSKAELVSLCGDIRQELIETVSNNGGHLASNLGVVELTVALHKVFDCPKDSIIFDVGHQCYTHKLLTGRREEFKTLRKKGGIAGFPKPAESEYDAFIAGHSSAALSAAIGLARAKQISGDDSKVIVLLGDGAFAGGMVYEAINNIDSSMTNLIVVLNDNEMSISKSVGSLAHYLLRLRTNTRYSRLKKAIQRILRKTPLIGGWIARMLLKSKSSLRRFFYGGTLFEELGFNYIGTVDGHDLDDMCRIFSNVRHLDGPILIHTLTVKGKGFTPAEENPGAYHGVGQFDIEEGNPDISLADSFSNVFGKKLCDIACKDDTVCGITAAMKYATGLNYFAKMHPERFYDVGIAEEHAVAFCAGLAKGGMKPVFAVYSTFLQRSFDQIVHDISLSKVPVLLAVDRAGFVGEDGETHHGLLDASIFLSLGSAFTVASPSSYVELEYWLEMLAGFSSACVVRYPRGNEDSRIKDHVCSGESFDIVVKSKEKKNLIVTYGREYAEAFEATENLNAKGVPCDILKLNIITPVPEQSVAEAAKYDNIIFAEEGIKAGGIAEHFLSLLYDNGFSGKYVIRAIEKHAVPHASVEEQLKMTRLDAASLEKLIVENN